MLDIIFCVMRLLFLKKKNRRDIWLPPPGSVLAAVAEILVQLLALPTVADSSTQKQLPCVLRDLFREKFKLFLSDVE